MTLLTIAKMHNVQFLVELVLSSLELQGFKERVWSALLVPRHSVKRFEVDKHIPLLFLGHSAEDDGKHYIGLSVMPRI